ncbi:filamentous hemagglutinin N-terminal domain-containing protein [Pantoea anthophila]|uniref:filamentous hemagglutinin N-terminal domain-containing protein n=1 Tax=Pantoea anthophila TaxID=470931 RepID=UPI002DBF69F6|nr:filamentous hemagglutinin N-terminal domain-containing protein [Pantoea anthophila]MEB7540532.1 filamentous hemagglutinin N-terminal domain-containing protein [Pantoea anthophila]
MNTHKFNLLFLATISTLCSQPALSALNSYQHANGSTVVNINQPDANGLSHNMYQNFNVSDKGLVLNNSTTDMIRDSGNIARNSNLDKSASLILNEVISRNTSSLNGFIEVAGQKADVIIANPNGITCSGCNFINTGRATLTTGTPVLTDGALTGFNVAKGTLTVKGNGLKGADYTDLLAQKINLQGNVETTELKAIAGKYTYNIASGLATASTTARTRGNSIDVSALGGATAGLIQLRTTEAGAGVNNNGILNATSLYISSNGTLTNNGTLKADMMSIAASGSMTNKGTLSASQAVLQTTNAFTNEGSVKTTNHASILSYEKVTNNEKGQISADGTVSIVSLAGDIENKGSIKTPGALTMQTGYSTVNGVTTPVANTSLINSGSIQAGDVGLYAVKEISLLSGGDITAQATASLSAVSVSSAGTLMAQNASVVSDEFSNQGVMQATERLSVTGKNSIYNRGTLKAGTLALTTDGKLSNASCRVWLLCKQGTMKADKITISAPKISSVTDLDGYYTTQLLELNKPETDSSL